VLHALTAREVRLLRLLFPHLGNLDLCEVEDLHDQVRLMARADTEKVACPGCGQPCVRVHDRYRRRLQDLACGGRPVQLEVEVRRLRCGNPACAVATFTEQIPGLTVPHRRRTAALHELLERLALALAGRAGSRLAHTLGAVVSRCTLVRMIRALPDPEIGPVIVLGVDDFAKHKGQSYATVLLNMDDHRVIDVLPDREADTLATWLREHPGVEVICRDRAGAYARGARQGAPDAIQVADRFHLWQSLGEAVEKTVIAHRAALRDDGPAADSSPDPGVGIELDNDAAPVTAPEPMPPSAEPTPAIEPDGYRDVNGKERRLVARHSERYASVQELLGQGCSLGEIARRLDIGRDTVRRFARATCIEEVLAKATSRAGILDPYKPYPNQRWREGIDNAAALHAELRTQGFTGEIQAVRRYLRQFRPADGRTRAGRAPTPTAAPAVPPPPKPRKVVRWIMSKPEQLTEVERAKLARILQRSPELAAAAGHVREFAAMLTELQGRHLDDWLAAVHASPLPALRSFATGLERDHDAVLAGLTLPHSSGAVEGSICKIKYLKRLMFGRANFDLLRKLALLN
jgi:Transposase and inactivated derivatives